MLDEFEIGVFNTLMNPVELEDIFEVLEWFFGFEFPCCPCIFIKTNPELLPLYETIRFHIIRSNIK